MKRTFLASAASVVTAILLFISCNKIDTTNLGSDLIPNVDNINTFDTILDVITDNFIFDDTTRMLYGEDHPLGIIENDAEFGKTTATLYSSFTPTAYRAYPFTKRQGVIIDSIVLSLGFTNMFGDTNAIQNLEVREISPRTHFSDSAHFIGGPDFAVEPQLIGAATVNYRTAKDTMMYRNARDTVRSAREIRIPLDTAWGRRFVEYDTTSGSPYSGDSLFKLSFKGLQVVASENSPSKNAISYIDLSDNNKSRITFYCRVENGSKLDTTVTYFAYTDDPHAAIVRRTPANNYLAALSNGTANDDKVYIQAAPGSYATVQIPGLSTLTNRVIHRAELICEKYPSAEDFYAAPGLMFIDAVNEAGDSTFTIRNDFVPTQAAPFYDINSLGGTYSKNRYVFNLSRYVQSIVTKGFSNLTLRIHSPFSTYPYYTQGNTDRGRDRIRLVINPFMAYGRVVLYGGAPVEEPKRMRLRIIYSKI